MMAVAASVIATAVTAAGVALFCAISAAGSVRRAANARELASAMNDGAARPKARSGRLAAAGVDVDPGTWAVLLTLLSAAGGFAGFILVGIPGLTAAAIGPAAATMWLRSRAKKRMAAFDEQLSRTLPLIAESMKGGGSTFPVAVAAAARTADEPLKSELEACAAAMAADGDAPAAIQDMAARTGSRDVAMLAAAVKVGRELGGSYAETLERIAASIDARIAIRRHIESETASAKASAKALTAMPAVLLAILCTMSPDTSAFFFTTGAGWASLAAVVALLAAGALMIGKMSDMKID